MWSKHYLKCEVCGTTTLKHVANGLCGVCYNRDYYKKNEDKIREYKKEWSKKRKDEKNIRERHPESNNGVADIQEISSN